jgi:hypothetical protein
MHPDSMRKLLWTLVSRISYDGETILVCIIKFSLCIDLQLCRYESNFYVSFLVILYLL